MQVNYSRIRDIVGDDNELIKTLMEMYVETFTRTIKSMEECLDLPLPESDIKWHEANHELKGSSYNLGFDELGDICAENERLTDNEKKASVINTYKSILGDVMETIAKIDI